MPNIDLLILAILQGVTEFLPVSASGHLWLVPQYYCWTEPTAVMQLAAIAGALLAVALYFIADIAGMTQGFLRTVQGKRDGRIRLIGLLLVAAIPFLAAITLTDLYVPALWRNLGAASIGLIVGCALVGFGIVLYGADKLGLTVRRVEHMSFGQALTIGVLQCLAIIPGAGGTAVTLTTTRLIGFERPDAARFSFLLTIPILAVFGGYKGWLLFQSGAAVDWAQAGLVFGVAAVSGFLAIAFMMYWVRRSGFLPFVLYRVVLGVVVVALFGLGGGFDC